jgi:deoxyhypusine synthase
MAKSSKKTVTGRVLHDPVKDKLRPIFPLDLAKCRTIDELVRAMGDTAYTARQIGDAADVLEAMARDKDCFVVNELFFAGYNRVYDSLEPESNLDHVEKVVDAILEDWDPEEIVCSWKLHRRIGEYLTKNAKGRGILKSAYEHNVPVYVPAFSDSELGLDFALNKYGRQRDGRPILRFDPFEDFQAFADIMMDTKKMGIFTIGGGVPRNWSQQFGVYAELMARRGYKKLPLKRYSYGVRICPEPANWGGLSGSTYTEAVSWGKFVPPEEGGKLAEVLDDATVALPLIVGAVLQRIGYFKK